LLPARKVVSWPAFSDRIAYRTAVIRERQQPSISAEGSEALAEYVLTAETGSMPPLSPPR
jgi:hypothetical protein